MSSGPVAFCTLIFSNSYNDFILNKVNRSFNKVLWRYVIRNIAKSLSNQLSFYLIEKNAMHCGSLVSLHFQVKWPQRGEHFRLEGQLTDFNDIYFSSVNCTYWSRTRSYFYYILLKRQRSYDSHCRENHFRAVD